VALLSFDLHEVAPHQLLELRSLLDEHAGRTPVRLQVAAPQGRVLYQVEGVRVDAEALTALESTCPWLRTRVTVDRQALLAERSNGRGHHAAAPGTQVPFRVRTGRAARVLLRTTAPSGVRGRGRGGSCDVPWARRGAARAVPGSRQFAA